MQRHTYTRTFILLYAYVYVLYDASECSRYYRIFRNQHKEYKSDALKGETKITVI
jgi:hypothetical protein